MLSSTSVFPFMENALQAKQVTWVSLGHERQLMWAVNDIVYRVANQTLTSHMPSHSVILVRKK